MRSLQRKEIELFLKQQISRAEMIRATQLQLYPTLKALYELFRTNEVVSYFHPTAEAAHSPLLQLSPDRVLRTEYRADHQGYVLVPATPAIAYVLKRS